MALNPYVTDGIVIRKRFKKCFDDEAKLIEDFHRHIQHYLSMAQGLNIGNITQVADHLKFALQSQLSSYIPERGRGFWSEYQGDETVSEASAQIDYRHQLQDLYLFTMQGVVRRHERHRLYIRTYSCYDADIEWNVGSLHADNEVGQDALRRMYNVASTCDDNVRNAMYALMGQPPPGVLYR